MPQTSAAHPLYLYVVFAACLAVTLALIAAPVVTELLRRRRERRTAVLVVWTPAAWAQTSVAYPAPAQRSANVAEPSGQPTRGESGLARHGRDEARRDVAGATHRLRRRVSA